MLLLECLLAASLLALMVSAWPAAVSWHEEYVLYLAAKELQMEETGTGPPLEQDRDSLLILSQQEQCWLIGSEWTGKI